MEAAQLIRSARTRRGLSQAELAARAGTSQPVISAYERGHRDPTTRTLHRLVAASGERLELRLAEQPPDLPPPADRHEHAARLVDLLGLADAFPARRVGRLTMPRLTSRR